MPRWSVRSADNGGSGYAISSRRRLFPVDVVCHSVFFRLHRRSLDHAELSFARGFQDRRFRNAEVLQPHAGSDDPVVFSSRRCVVDELVTVPVTVVVITMALGIYAPEGKKTVIVTVIAIKCIYIYIYIFIYKIYIYLYIFNPRSQSETGLVSSLQL